jgi:hypothetical protein
MVWGIVVFAGCLAGWRGDEVLPYLPVADSLAGCKALNKFPYTTSITTYRIGYIGENCGNTGVPFAKER